MNKIEFEINSLPKMTNSINSHWVRFSNRRKWHRLVSHALMTQKLPDKPLISAVLTLTRYSSSEPDYDGLVSGFKAVIDGLVQCGILATDKMSCIGVPVYLWEKCKRGEGKIRVKVTYENKEVEKCTSDRY